ncbi:MAG: S8 family serine peptidase, partial [Alphaproteobacteria bacterium]
AGSGAGLDGFEEGEILAVGGADLAQRARSLGFSVVDRASLAALELEILRLRTPLAARTKDALRIFRKAFPGAVADVNGHIRPAARSRGWNAARTVGWPDSPLRCGRDITIGMIDTPVDAAHQAFLGRDIRYKSFLKGNHAPADPQHGTAVAALLVGDPNSDGFGGLLPEATLIAAGIFERSRTGQTVGNVYALLRALDWMVRERVRVVNLSLETRENAVLSRALDRSLRGGRILIAAAGNGGAGARPAFPAAHPQVLAVTAIDPGLEPYAHANHGSYIDFAAPGVSLWTAVPGGGRFQSGTSFAAPFLTAVAALQVRAGVEPSAEAIRGSLVRSVRDLGAPGKDEVFGWGLLSFTPSCG